MRARSKRKSEDTDAHTRVPTISASQRAAIAAQPPAFPAGTKGAYNTINIGFILGEVVRKVTGETIGTFIREEISEPLGAEYNLGLTPDEAALCATMHTNPENKFWLRPQGYRLKAEYASAQSRRKALSA